MQHKECFIMAPRLSRRPASNEVLRRHRSTSRRLEMADLTQHVSSRDPPATELRIQSNTRPRSSPKRRRPKPIDTTYTQESSRREYLRLPSLASVSGCTYHESHPSPKRHSKLLASRVDARLPQIKDDDTQSSGSTCSSADSTYVNAHKSALQFIDHASRRQSSAKKALASTNQISSSLKNLLEDSQQALVIARKSREEAENNAMRAEQAVQKMKEAGELARKDRERADLEMDEANAQAEEALEYFQSIRSMIKHNKKQSRHHIAKGLKSNTRIGTVAKEASELAKKDSHLEMDEANVQAEEAFEYLRSNRSMNTHEKQSRLANAASMIEATSSTLHANENSSKRSEVRMTGKFSTESRRRVSKKDDDKTKQDETLIEPEHKFQGHEAPITQVAAIDQVHFISSSWDKTVRLWNADTGECKQTFQGHKDWVQAICKLDNEHFISGSDDRTMKLWNINRPECLRTFRGHGSFVKSIATMSGGRFLSGSRDRKIKLWQTSSDQCVRTFDGHDDVVTAIVSLDSKLFVSGSHDKSIRCWNAKTGVCVRTITGHRPIKTLAAVSDNSRNVDSLIVSGDDKSIRLWDVLNGACLHEFDCCVSIFSLTSICEGFFLSSGGNKIQLYHLASRKVVKSYETPRISLAVARLDDDRFITGSDQVLQVWKF